LKGKLPDLADRLRGRSDILQTSHRQRVQRILAGHGRSEDFGSLFVELRAKTYGSKRFREIGDFVGHRDVRNRGLIVDVVRDFASSMELFIEMSGNKPPSLEVACAGAKANLRLSTDEQIASTCAMSKASAEQAIDRATVMLKQGLLPSERDKFVFNSYTARIVWHPAFLDDDIVEEWITVLTRNNLLEKVEVVQMRQHSERLILYVLTLLHGVAVELQNKKKVTLQAGFFNRERRLEVKAYLNFDSAEKPMFAPLAVFLTSLQPEGLCENHLLESELHGWVQPIYLADDGLLRVEQ
jgi:hypothetical protein